MAQLKASMLESGDTIRYNNSEHIVTNVKEEPPLGDRPGQREGDNHLINAVSVKDGSDWTFRPSELQVICLFSDDENEGEHPCNNWSRAGYTFCTEHTSAFGI